MWRADWVDQVDRVERQVDWVERRVEQVERWVEQVDGRWTLCLWTLDAAGGTPKRSRTCGRKDEG